MKKLIIAAFSAVLMTACVKVDFNETINQGGGGGTNPGDTIPAVLTGRIDRNLTLPKGKYRLRGFVYVGNGATLTFAPGCVVLAVTSEKSALIIEQGGKLVADGVPNDPIVFTSDKPKGQRREFDWGGISICGLAPTNRPLVPAPITEGGSNRPYGGTAAGDNSGILRYVRVEFAGVTAENNSELNGITFYGVGAGTIVENVMTSYCGDDGFEFFGGTVNCKNLISFASGDDDFDFDFGYNGQIQFAVSLRDKYSDDDDANQIECDNDASGTAATPFTRPVLSNFTLIGPADTSGIGTNGSRHRFGNRWRRNTRFEIRNSVIIGQRDFAFYVENDPTIDAFVLGESVARNNILGSFRQPTYGSSNNARLPVDSMMRVLTRTGNSFIANRDSAYLTSAFNLNNPNFLPAANSPALTGANYTGLSAFFATGTFRGAFGTVNWTAPWANWNPQNTDY
ncbi:MAG: hypothetical protein EAY75_14775 [Bacteroidetes bacterium]|nr:MAG: hypothetical protein EAY75_14775 [Bacteroidota bacterium]